MPKISIIIPVYNIEKYLPQCLDSLKKQTLSDLEFICINDGSTDGSLEILQQYAAQDSRFVIINQNNRGQGYARNQGIARANGEYIAFVDPDDWIEPEMYATMYDLAKQYSADMVECKYNQCVESLFGTRTKKVNIKLPLPETSKNVSCFNFHQLPPTYLLLYPIYAVWNKIISKDLIIKENIRFTEGRFGEDVIFTVHCRLCSALIVQTKQIFYHYRIRKNSSCFKVSDNRFDFIKAMHELKDLFIRYDTFSQQEEYFHKFIVTVFQGYYNTTPPERQEEFKQKYFELLPVRYHHPLESMLKQKTRLSWKEKLFSRRTLYKLKFDSKDIILDTYHILTVFGIKIKLKPKSR